MAETPLGDEIQTHLVRLGWSQRELGSKSGITSSAISKIIRGKNRPTPETINAIAEVLGLNPLYLMNLAGIPVPSEKTDPSIEYIAQQLTQLPQPIRTLAVNAIRTQVRAFYSLMERYEPLMEEENKEEPETHPKLRELAKRVESMEEAIKDKKALERAMGLIEGQLEVLEMAAKRS